MLIAAVPVADSSQCWVVQGENYAFFADFHGHGMELMLLENQFRLREIGKHNRQYYCIDRFNADCRGALHDSNDYFRNKLQHRSLSTADWTQYFLQQPRAVARQEVCGRMLKIATQSAGPSGYHQGICW